MHKKPHVPRRLTSAHTRATALLKQADPVRLCRRCGTILAGGQISLHYFNRIYQIDPTSAVITPPGLSGGEEILLLHYLTSEGQTATRGEYLNYRNLPGGMFYDYAYQKNGPARIMARFGNAPDKLLAAARFFGGVPAEWGDLSVCIPVLPVIDIIVVMHGGDTEFPPEVNILYPDKIINFLSLEDISLLTGYLAGHLGEATAV